MCALLMGAGGGLEHTAPATRVLGCAQSATQFIALLMLLSQLSQSAKELAYSASSAPTQVAAVACILTTT